VLLHCCYCFPCCVNNGAVSRFLLLNLILRIFLHVFFDEWWWFSIFQVFPNDLSILLIMVLFNCSFASQGLASCWLWRPLMFAVVQRFYLAFWRFASFFFFPCSFNKGAVSRFLLLHLFCACFCYTLFCESGSWSRNKECILFFFQASPQRFSTLSIMMTWIIMLFKDSFVFSGLLHLSTFSILCQCKKQMLTTAPYFVCVCDQDYIYIIGKIKNLQNTWKFQENHHG
jgi:hypothetical protein